MSRNVNISKGTVGPISGLLGGEQGWPMTVLAYRNLLSQSSVVGMCASATGFATTMHAEAKQIKCKLDRKQNKKYEKYRGGWEFVNQLFCPPSTHSSVTLNRATHPLDVMVAEEFKTAKECKPRSVFG